MNKPHNARFIRALKRQTVDRTPVWIMRQAGRYLPEYRLLRQKAGSFLNLCKTPEWACEITLQPLARFDLDAAVIFSDILTIPDAMGLELSFETEMGPLLGRPIQTHADVQRLPLIDPEEDLGYVMQAIRLVCEQACVPVLGFCGSPWTVATYMVEGKSTRQFNQIKKMMYHAPQTLLLLLEKLAKASTLYLQAQIAAGASAVMVFDTWGGILTPQDFQTFSLPFMQHIVSELKKTPGAQDIPIILFTKHGGQWLEELAQTGCDALGLDWTVDIGKARQRVGHQVALQGNLDPATLYGPAAKIRQAVKAIITAYGEGTGHVFNLGHGIQPEVPPENVAVMIEAVKEFSPAFHEPSLA